MTSKFNADTLVDETTQSDINPNMPNNKQKKTDDQGSIFRI